MQDCVFCKISNGSIPSAKVWEDDRFFAFLDLRPINDGHTLLVPKNHTDYIFDLPADLYQGLFERGKFIAPHLKMVTGCKRVGLAVEGFGVPHAHLHLVPINHGNELSPENAHPVSDESLKDMQRRIIASINAK